MRHFWVTSKSLYQLEQGKIFNWKLRFIYTRVGSYFHRKLYMKPCYEKEAKRYQGMASGFGFHYLIIISLPQDSCGLLSIQTFLTNKVCKRQWKLSIFFTQSWQQPLCCTQVSAFKMVYNCYLLGLESKFSLKNWREILYLRGSKCDLPGLSSCLPP